MFSPQSTSSPTRDRGPRAGDRRAGCAYTERARDLHQALNEAVLGSTDSPERKAERLWREGSVLATYLLPDAPVERAALAASIQRRAAQLIRNHDLDREAVARRRRCHAHFADRLSLRAWSAQDAERYRTLMDDVELWRYLPERRPEPFTTALAQQLIEIGNELPEQQQVWAVVQQDEPIGQFRVEWDRGSAQSRAEVSYWIGRDHWGAGHASAVVAHGCRLLFATHGTLDYLYARVMVGNDASNAVLRNAGFRFEYMEQPAQDRWSEHRVCRYGLYRITFAQDLADAGP